MSSYDGPVIDAHHHLWSLAGDHYPWLLPTGGFAVLPDMDVLRTDYVVEDYLRDVAGQGVVATVHIEALPADPLWETRWLDSLPKDQGVAARYVAGCPFGTDDTERIMREQAEFGRVSGVRQTIAWHPDPERSPLPAPELTRDPAWRRGVALAEQLGLSLDLLMFPWQSDEIVELARLHPDLVLVVNHCASPIERGEDDLADWRRNVALLAGAPNVVMKISSLGSYDPAPTQASFDMVIGELVDAFGPDRAMFASDWPVGTMKMTFADVYALYRASVADLAPDEQRALFHDTAARVYSIEQPGAGTGATA
jgi:predicted TIM-barrel fold metal-dependent hydrolase